jgi:hypothetical protein
MPALRLSYPTKDFKFRFDDDVDSQNRPEQP